jgi:hypothetical protein
MMNLLAPDRRSNDVAVPKIADISPEYVEIIKLQEELNERLQQNIAEMKEIRRRQGESVPALATAKDDDARFAKLLNGFAPTLAAENSGEPDGVRFAYLSQEVDYIRDKALPLLVEKSRIVMRAASRVICERVEDHHRAIVREMAALLRDVHEVNAKYWALVQALLSDGVSWGPLGPAFFVPIGHPADRSSALAQWFKDAAAAGHIKKSEIPEAFR